MVDNDRSTRVHVLVGLTLGGDFFVCELDGVIDLLFLLPGSGNFPSTSAFP